MGSVRPLSRPTTRRPVSPLALGAAVLALLAWASSAVAQTTSGTLVGTVRLERGEPVADAVVQARAVETGLVRTAVTNEAGGYRL